MRNLISFLIRNSKFFFFLFLQLIALSLMFNNNGYQRSSFINTSNALAGSVLEKKQNLTDYFLLEEENDLLHAENAKIRSNKSTSFYKLSEEVFVFEDTLYQQQFTYSQAKVINATVNKINNFLTIDIGSMKGIAPGMAVIGQDGIVGLVKDVSSHYATIRSVLNSAFKTSVIINKTNYFGILSWNGTDPLRASLTGITRDIPVEIGSKVLTRGASGKFPGGILIGEIEKVSPVPNGTDLDIVVKLSTDYRSLYHVYVIHNKFKFEFDQLQKQLEP